MYENEYCKKERKTKTFQQDFISNFSIKKKHFIV